MNWAGWHELGKEPHRWLPSVEMRQTSWVVPVARGPPSAQEVLIPHSSLTNGASIGHTSCVGGGSKTLRGRSEVGKMAGDLRLPAVDADSSSVSKLRSSAATAYVSACRARGAQRQVEGACRAEHTHRAGGPYLWTSPLCQQETIRCVQGSLW